MGLLERVGRLVRANLNDLIDRAEDPRKMLKQVILDMQNQLLQVKTQVAIAIADQHLLEKKRAENAEAEAEYLRRAEISVNRGREDLARVSLDKALRHRQMAEGFGQQLGDQRSQVEHLKGALRELESKLQEAQHQAELLITRQRRARALARTSDARSAVANEDGVRRMKDKVFREESMAEAKAELAAGDPLSRELEAVSRKEAVEEILREIKSRRSVA